MGDRHRGVAVQQELGDRLADDIAAAHDDGLFPRQGNARTVDQAQDAHKVMPLVDGNGWEYHVLLDPNGTLKRAMNVQNVPHLFVLNSKGEIVYNHAGYMDGEELEIRKYLK
jgi:hypothetical protein